MTAWLTRITPDTRIRDARLDLGDAAAMHRRLMSLFPDSLGPQPRVQAGLLFRIDRDQQSQAIILAQSTTAPDLGRLPDGYGRRDHRSLTPMLEALTEGLTIRFRLTANASKRAWKGDDRHTAGQVVPLGGADAEHWWRSRAEQHHGLGILELRTESQQPVRGRRSGHMITHAATRFDGVAVIRDPHALRTAVLSGVGRGKAYGCGLLSLALART